MTVTTHVAWYWRMLGLVAVLSCSLALAAWMYDAGRRFAGFDRSEAEQELSQLRENVGKLMQETASLRANVNASESKLQIERAAQTQLGRQVKALEDENARLKEDLAFFENLIPGEHRDNTLLINRFRVDPGALPGEFRYRLLLLQGGRRDKPFQGNLQLLVTLQQDGKGAIITLPEEGAAPAYKISFKYFQRVEGTFRVAPGARVKMVQVRIFESGFAEARATQSFNLS
ncbi:MAG: hypothetical protein A3G80_10795 [Betaproteobacteria bacterium RIFCSPLOWO2_12_FULL_62_13b]|nr:MAG: hypothetical protein A3G80_10795 [Betaproteobacteria bacterium RIFCSPLOWO2_12_FULL_62_13b]